VALDVEDFSFFSDGSGRVLIRRSKTDQVGEGSVGDSYAENNFRTE
jgi:hypothetical protein